MYKNGDVCPICGRGRIKAKKNRETFEYKDRLLTLDLTVYCCCACGESFYDNREMKKHQKTIKDFQRETDGLLTSKEIKEIREKYGLSQLDLAKALGVAKKSIAKYEAGLVAQSKAMDNLLRVIREFPEVLEFLITLNQSERDKYDKKIVHLENYRYKLEKRQTYTTQTETYEDLSTQVTHAV